jgi:uncharacterized Tic20 family protein
MTDPGGTGGPPPDGAGAAPPPGWYPDPYGQSRWWDGHAWGVAAPATGGSDPRQTAMLSHLLALLTGFIGPLIMYSMESSKRDPFVRHHTTEALNFSLTVLIASLVCIPLMFICIGFLLIPIISIGAIVYGIQACIAANRGEWYRYPVCLRMVGQNG